MRHVQKLIYPGKHESGHEDDIGANASQGVNDNKVGEEAACTPRGLDPFSHSEEEEGIESAFHRIEFDEAGSDHVPYLGRAYGLHGQQCEVVRHDLAEQRRLGQQGGQHKEGCQKTREPRNRRHHGRGWRLLHRGTGTGQDTEDGRRDGGRSRQNAGLAEMVPSGEGETNG